MCGVRVTASLPTTMPSTDVCLSAAILTKPIGIATSAMQSTHSPRGIRAGRACDRMFLSSRDVVLSGVG